MKTFVVTNSSREMKKIVTGNSKEFEMINKTIGRTKILNLKKRRVTLLSKKISS